MARRGISCHSCYVTTRIRRVIDAVTVVRGLHTWEPSGPGNGTSYIAQNDAMHVRRAATFNIIRGLPLPMKQRTIPQDDPHRFKGNLAQVEARRRNPRRREIFGAPKRQTLFGPKGKAFSAFAAPSLLTTRFPRSNSHGLHGVKKEGTFSHFPEAS